MILGLVVIDMACSILEIGMPWKRSRLDPTVDVILDACIYLTKGEVHTLMVTHEGAPK
jgi:hypothetical protein